MSIGLLPSSLTRVDTLRKQLSKISPEVRAAGEQSRSFLLRLALEEGLLVLERRAGILDDEARGREQAEAA